MQAARQILIRCVPLLVIVAILDAGQSVQRLTLGQTIDAELKGGDVHRYEVELPAGTYFAVTFDQRGGDVRPVIIGPDGRTLYDYDGSEWGWEPALVIAPERWRDPYFWAGFVIQGDWRDRQAVH
jgi:CHAT domain-containing protein